MNFVIGEVDASLEWYMVDRQLMVVFLGKIDNLPGLWLGMRGHG